MMLLPDIYRVIDVETTELAHPAIIEIAIIDEHGGCLLNTLVSPGDALISPRASAVHGIVAHDLRNAPHLPDLWPALGQILAGHVVFAFNAQFDSRALAYDAYRYGLPLPEITWQCAMLAATQHSNQRRFLSLDKACAIFHVPRTARHRAADDALAAQKLLQRLAAVPSIASSVT